MRPFPRRPAAAAVLAAALLALTACSSSPSHDAGDDAAAAAPPSGTAGGPAARVTPAPEPSDARTGQSATPSASLGPVLPDAQLTPVTGTFTKKEKHYLSGRVPKNMDPAAVLQTGQEACQRVALTAKHSRDDAVGAVIAGDIPDAADAINQLCPDQKPLLAAARTGFPDGKREKPAAGTYRALTTDPSCTWRAVGAGGKPLASGPAPGANGKVTAKVPAGTEEFISSGCYAWLPA